MKPRFLLAAMALASTVPAGAVGLGPLVLDGIIDGPRRAFYLDIVNPYPEMLSFVAYAVGAQDETPASRVSIIPSEMVMGSQGRRKLLVIASGIQVGEKFSFRVCAQRKTPPEGVMINARVCSKLSARRVL